MPKHRKWSFEFTIEPWHFGVIMLISIAIAIILTSGGCRTPKTKTETVVVDQTGEIITNLTRDVEHLRERIRRLENDSSRLNFRRTPPPEAIITPPSPHGEPVEIARPPRIHHPGSILIPKTSTK